jgi:hypothetical protein
MEVFMRIMAHWYRKERMEMYFPYEALAVPVGAMYEGYEYAEVMKKGELTRDCRATIADCAA